MSAAALTAALAEHRSGNLDAAERVYVGILAAAPANPVVLNLLGVLYCQTRRIDRAVVLLEGAAQLAPGEASYLVNLGHALRQAGRLEDAARRYRQALEAGPQALDVRLGLGETLRLAGRFAEAAEQYRAIVAAEAGSAVAWSGLGTVLMLLGQGQEAANAFERALALDPQSAAAACGLGNARRLAGDAEAAAAAFARALQIRPDHDLALANLVHQRRQLCDWAGLEALEGRLIGRVRAGATAVNPFILLNLASTPADQLAAARAYMAARCGAPRPLAPAAPAADGRIRIGYLSADFHEHATAYLAAELFERHDRRRFTVAAYSFGPLEASPMRRRLMAAFDRFVEIGQLGHEEAAQRIRDDGVDILVDLKGITLNARPEILALRPAPVQVSFLGYPGTTGAGFIDYVVADAFVAPMERQDAFSERIVHLPGCYQVNDGARPEPPEGPGRAASGLPEAAFVFCAFHPAAKLSPAVFAIWMRLLKAIPGSVLWLLEPPAPAVANLRAEARSAGVDPARLVFAPFLPLPAHLARHRHADLYLDAFPCGAHTSASDAVRSGVPIVTCAGETFASRVAGSLLRALGLPHFVTNSLASYEMLALHLARSPGVLAASRRRLADAMRSSGVIDGARFARRLEHAFSAMWATHAKGEPPRPFAVGGDPTDRVRPA